MDKEGFERRISETMYNAEGVRGPTDHLRRLVPEIEALRQDGVKWAWITRRLNAVRQDENALTAHKVRSYWSDSGKRPGAQARPPRIAPGPPQPRLHRAPLDPLEKAQVRQARTDARNANK